MTLLSQLRNSYRPRKNVQRVGRGGGSKRGKTCCRGHKGDKARRGYKRHWGLEGGQMPLYKKIPTRGFPNARFQSAFLAINLADIEQHFKDGEVVNLQSLREKGLASHRLPGGLKILAEGALKKKVSIEAHAVSRAAAEKLEKGKITFTLLPLTAATR